MMDVNTELSAEVEGYVPTVCTESPAFGKAFCSVHCEKVEALGYPSNLRQFLKSCATDNTVDPDAYTKDMKKIVDKKIKEISKEIDVNTIKIRSSTYVQGTTYLLRKREFKNPTNFAMDGEGADCNKDTGSKARLRRWSRGFLVTVTGGGIIKHFAPLYKAENPVQVAMIFMKFLQSELKDTDKTEWKKKYLSYDNMCNVARLHMMRKPLPLEGDMKYVWQEIQKCIDPLHISNHQRNECHVLYPPSKVTDEYPDANLMTCEQLFSWLGRFRKILNSMTKNHCHFFMHRMVIRRNRYTEYCHKSGKYPLLPSVKVLKRQKVA